MAEPITLTVGDGSRMAGYAARPEAGTRVRGGMVVLQEAFGVNHHIRAVTERFAGYGYVAVAPELYHRTGPGFEGDYTNFTSAMPHMKALTETGMEQDVRAALEWLTGVGEVAAAKCGAAGFCLGGRVAVLASTRMPLAAAASFYGGNLPSLVGQVAGLQGPLLLGWGGKDTHIPLEQRMEFAAALREEKKTHVEVTFSDADHGFLCDERKSYHAPSAQQAWALMLAFFDQYLGQ